MADVWDIARHVEEHPEDYEQRWRLAKKLYMGWEYRLALEHLQVLKNEWVPKINVGRYLAAAYYRLGRYDEAIAELEEAIGAWPEEVTLREQLARVLEIADRPIDAEKVWKDILALDPEHPLAKRAIVRLRKRILAPPSAQPVLLESNAGADSGSVTVCSRCGARNSREFERCWQCHAPLPVGQLLYSLDETTPHPMPVIEAAPKEVSFSTWVLAGGLSVVALLSCGLYLSLKSLSDTEVPGGGLVISRTMTDLFAHELAQTHIVLGVLLLVMWPLVLWVSMVLIQSPPFSRSVSIIVGLVLAALAYVLSWAPGNPFLLTFLAPAIVSLVLVIGAFRIRLGYAVGAWLLQGFLVAVIAFLGFIAIEGPDVIRQFPVIVKHVSDVADKGAREGELLPGGNTPLLYAVEWMGTGSPWLDKTANTVLIEVRSESAQERLTIELKDGAKTLAYEPAAKGLFRTKQKVTPGRLYQLTVSDQDGVPISVALHGILHARASKQEG